MTEREPRIFGESESGRRGQILDAALGVFGERGFDAGTMRQIAARVGVSEPALYRHFPGKDAIFGEIIRLGVGRVRREVLSILGDLQADGLRDRLLGAFRNRREAVRLYRPLLRVIAPRIVREDRFVVEIRAQVAVPVLAALTRKSIEIDAALGVPDADVTRDARVRAMLALIVGYLASSFVIGDEPDEAVVDAALRVMRWDREPLAG